LVCRRPRKSHLGWQPSRLLADRAESERAFQFAERLGSINAANQLGTTWPSLHKAFHRHGLGMPAYNPQAVRQRAAEAARQRSGRPVTPDLDPVFLELNRDEFPIRARLGGELAERTRRAEDYAVPGARVVVELHTESHATKPSTRAWAATRRAPTAVTRIASSAASGGRPTGSSAPADPARAGTGCRRPMMSPTARARRQGGSAPIWSPTRKPVGGA
jgi:hypothetical protein